MVQIAYQRRFQSSLIIILHRNENCHHVVVVSTQSKHIEMHQFPNSKSKNRKFLKPSPSSELLQQTKNPKKQKTEKKKQTQRFQCRSASCPPKVSLSISGNKPSKMASLIWSQGIRNPPKKGEEMTWGPPFKGSPSFSWSLIWGSLLREYIYIIDIYIYTVYVSILLGICFEIGFWTTTLRVTAWNWLSATLATSVASRFVGLAAFISWGEQGWNGIGIIADNGRNSLHTPNSRTKKAVKFEKHTSITPYVKLRENWQVTCCIELCCISKK